MLSTSWILPLSLIVLIFAFNWCMPSQPIEPQPPAAGIPITKNEQVEGQPPRTPYNEDEIVQLIKDIYDTYLRLNHIKRWELIWPPNETGHVINETLCQELGLDLAVISLMKRIPYFYDSDTSKNVEFFEYSRAMVYLEDEEVLGDRDPGMFEVQEPRLDHLLRHDIALICTEDEGKNIILDVRENTIRVEDSMDVAPGRDVPPDYEYKPERLDVKNHYRNYYPHHAPTWLASLLEKVRKLEIVPVNYGGHRWLCAGDDREGLLAKRVLQEKFGHPDNFREARWRASGSAICKKIGDGNVDYEVVARYVDSVDYKEGQDGDSVADSRKPVYA